MSDFHEKFSTYEYLENFQFFLTVQKLELLQLLLYVHTYLRNSFYGQGRTLLIKWKFQK